MSETLSEDKIRGAAKQAKGALAETAEAVTGAAIEAGDKAQEFAREAGRQASAAAQNLYGQGNVVLDALERSVVENPWSALLIAGALGYGMACIVKHR
jgi:ElaB/YqjD/DUF883 family membrane-anchored ribosome-binding protein